MSRTYVAVDVETTGLDPYRDAIIEIAVVRFNEDEILEAWSSLVDPGCEIPPFITQLTGIRQEMVDDAPSILSLRSRLRALLGDDVIVGHNVSFDMGFLEEVHVGAGQHRLDTVTLASILYADQARYGLAELSRVLELALPAGTQAHRALGDARLTALLFQRLYAAALQLDYAVLNEIVEAGSRIGWPETLFFEEVLRAAGRSAFGQRQRLPQLFNPPPLQGTILIPADEPEPIDAELIAGMLSPEGNFGRAFPGYEFRPQQVEMAFAVATAFNQGQHLIVEAGTGTGKSIGYLLPAAFWAQHNDRRVVVSTNTINLQDQLIAKDLPQLQQLLPFELRATILKGKRNYICTRLFRQMRHMGPGNADEMTLYARLLLWLPQTQSGDMAEIALRTPGERLAWQRLSAENDGCRPDHCLEERCPLHMARRRAEQAHILIVNHSLLLADVAAGNRVLPPYTDLIVDEAHHLEAAVTDGLSFRADRRYLETLLDQITGSGGSLVTDLQARVRAALPAQVSATIEAYTERLRDVAREARDRLDDFFNTLEYFLQDYANPNSQYSQQIRLLPALRTQPAWEHVEVALDNLLPHLDGIGKGLHDLAEGVAEVAHSHDLEGADDLEGALQSLANSFETTVNQLQAIIAAPAEGMIYWAELSKNWLSLHAAPLDVGPLVEEHIFAEKETVILTSATLRTAAAGGNGQVDFSYLRQRLHADHANDLAVGSPFDYERNALLYLVRDMPEPNQPGYQRFVEEAVVAVARALGGRTMVLFTSYGQLRATTQAVSRPLAESNIAVLSQGDGISRQQLLEQFRAEDSRAVLLGTRSFWEGVDVPGVALSAVLIARLPFDVPSDPIFAARSETFDSPFFEYSIPEAVLRFRQGFGRLIRRRDDEGIVVVLDKRMLTRRYGQAFLDALPACTVIRQPHNRLGELVERWFNRER
ncbi:MAG: helicase C-terminal domain-containing protein [Anaerolineae bacterium]|nr:helicase C-terminal domain-containing protein [Anaerolineae bacterium]